MKRIINFLVLAALLSPVSVLAADVTADGDVTLSLGSNNYNLVNTSKFDSLTTTGNDNWSFSMSDGSSARITSSDKYSFTVSPATFSTVCDTSQSSIGINVPSGSTAQTITITPSSSSCTSVANNGASGGGILYTSSGGGGGGNTAATTAATTKVATAQTTTTTSSATTVAQPSTVSPVFNSNLVRGSRGNDVKRLQQLLSQDKTLYPEGVTNGTYGPSTEKAIQKFQEKYGIAKKGNTGYGRLGPATRAKIQQVFGGVKTTASSQTSAPATSSSNSKAIQVKTLQDQLKVLQNLLKTLKK